MEKLGVFATEDEVKMLDDMLKTPMVMLQCGPPPNAAKECHRLAREHGLPEIPGYYGIDLDTREFLTEEPIRLTVHRCNKCSKEFAVCDGEPVFGNGKGNDNVYCCPGFVEDDS